MSSPIPMETPPYTNLFVGDVKDDDAQIIDENVLEVDRPAEPLTEPFGGVHGSNLLIAPKKITRVLSGFIVLDSTYIQPVMILPADANRTDMRIDVTSLAASPSLADYVFLADENGKCGSSGAYRFRNGKGWHFDDHTGPVYVLPNPTVQSPGIEVTWVATTC